MPRWTKPAKNMLERKPEKVVRARRLCRHLTPVKKKGKEGGKGNNSFRLQGSCRKVSAKLTSKPKGPI